MSNHEIEDVLSSIRRLVSEDLRPSPRVADEVAPEAADKLILTPALRVVTAPDEPDVDAVAEIDATEPVAVAAPAAPVEDVVARLGAAVTEEEWESPFGDPEVWPGSLPSDAVPTFVPHVRKPVEEAAPEGGSDDLPDGFSDLPMADFAEIEDVLPEAAPMVAEVRREPVRTVTPPQDDSAWADEAEAAVRADLAQEAEEEVISGLYDAQAGGMAFDEDVLRDLVRDLIREELSGTLGERITRNVRKLVRAEIARAMALREFE